MTTQVACGVAVAIASLWVAATPAFAEEMSFNSTCQDVGRATPEPLGDQGGHAITVAPYSCRVDTGALSGAIMTGTVIWEWKGTEAVMLSDSGVLRASGGTMVYRDTGGKLTLVMADGKVTGFTASGQGQAVLATGTAAYLGGKTTNWTAKSNGFGQFAVEDKWQ